MLGLPGISLADEVTGPLQAEIPGPISDGTPAAPTPPVVLPDAVVISTTTTEIEVVAPPPMAGLPPLSGTIISTVKLVQDPGLPDPIPPTVSPDTPALPPTLPARQIRQLVCISATVYDHACTFLRWYPSGKPEKKMAAWSNLDFNHFSGFSSYQVKGRDGVVRTYALMLGLGAGDARRELPGHVMQLHSTPEHPALPDLATAGPAFVITEGDTTDKECMDIIQGMHDLYRVEGARMETGYLARITANEERRAELLAHPPKPDDVTVLFWQRDHPLTPISSAPAEGNTP